MRASPIRSDVRPAAVAGLFYPEDAHELAIVIDDLLAGPVPTGPAPKALVVPHAGYRYSGATAARAFRSLRPAAERIRRVVLVGPSHREWFRGLAVPRATAFATPLGPVSVDTAAVERLVEQRLAIAADAPHALEHSLEVQLPFLVRVVPTARIVPVVVGEATAAAVEQALEVLWDGPETVVVVSSDLSHYHPYDEARTLDAATARTILDALPSLHGENACGSVPVNGLLRVIRQHGLRAALIDMCNSGDTAGDRDRVVGYGAFGFYEA